MAEEIYNELDVIKESLGELSLYVLENMDSGELKRHILDELSKLEALTVDTKQICVEGKTEEKGPSL